MVMFHDIVSVADTCCGTFFMIQHSIHRTNTVSFKTGVQTNESQTPYTMQVATTRRQRNRSLGSANHVATTMYCESKKYLNVRNHQKCLDLLSWNDLLHNPMEVNKKHVLRETHDILGVLIRRFLLACTGEFL